MGLFHLNGATVPESPTLPIPNDIPLTSRHGCPCVENVVESTGPVTLRSRHGIIVTWPPRILRVAYTTHGLGACGAALNRIGDGDLINGDTIVGRVAWLVDALVAVRGADNVVALALVIGGGCWGNNGLDSRGCRKFCGCSGRRGFDGVCGRCRCEDGIPNDCRGGGGGTCACLSNGRWRERGCGRGAGSEGSGGCAYGLDECAAYS